MTKRSFAMALAMAVVAGLVSSAPCRAGTYITTVTSINNSGLAADDFEAYFTGTAGTISDVTVEYSSGLATTTEIISSGAGVEVDFSPALADGTGVVVFSFESDSGPIGLANAFWTFKSGDMIAANLTQIDTVDPPGVPEPSSMSLLGIGVAGLFAWRRFSRRKAGA
jgi:hypothetical protein